MNILSLDTSAKVSSVAVVSEDDILSEFSVNVKLTHSQTIMPMCEQVLKCASLSAEDIDAFAVSSGPGSFTGLRIGIAAIKGLAFATDKPCIGVSTLEALAYNLLGFQGIICCVMDARCNQVYNALFESNGQKLTRLCEDRAISICELESELKNLQTSIFLVGDGAVLCYNNIRTVEHFTLAPTSLRLAKASSVGFIAKKKFDEGIHVSASDLMPEYLRLPQAERELQQKIQQQNGGILK
ncbi:MAG: peptidase glycoprotease [Oscillospiraceae bacterium]|nr:peptidase glycoprotease [Oscillospiraceae bacterium]